MDEKISQEFDHLGSELRAALVDLNAALPSMRAIGRQLVEKLGRDEAARVTQTILAKKPSVEELVKVAGSNVVKELAQFVIGATDKLDLENLARRARQSD